MKYIKLKNSVGLTREMKVGFSWTTFFFGGWVALFRGQWGELVKWIFLNPITLGIWGLVQCWTANKKQIISFLEKGYEPMTEDDRLVLMAKAIIS